MKPKQIATGADVLDIVFARRNKAYGAYQLRREYPEYIGKALGIAFLLICFFIASSHVLSRASRAKALAGDGTEVVICNCPPPDAAEHKPLPPIPKTPPPPQARSTLKFVPPVVLVDGAVREPEPLIPVDEMNRLNMDIGASNHKADVEGPPALGAGPGQSGAVLEHPAPREDDTVYNPGGVQKMPGFPGGEKELLMFLARNIKYPVLAQETGIEGQVVLSFVVDKDGSITNVTPMRELGGGCTKEAVRVVQSMPRWTPGEANGNPVKVRFYLPVRFELQ